MAKYKDTEFRRFDCYEKLIVSTIQNQSNGAIHEVRIGQLSDNKKIISNYDHLHPSVQYKAENYFYCILSEDMKKQTKEHIAMLSSLENYAETNDPPYYIRTLLRSGGKVFADDVLNLVPILAEKKGRRIENRNSKPLSDGTKYVVMSERDAKSALEMFDLDKSTITIVPDIEQDHASALFEWELPFKTRAPDNTWVVSVQQAVFHVFQAMVCEKWECERGCRGEYHNEMVDLMEEFMNYGEYYYISLPFIDSQISTTIDQLCSKCQDLVRSKSHKPFPSNKAGDTVPWGNLEAITKPTDYCRLKKWKVGTNIEVWIVRLFIMWTRLEDLCVNGQMKDKKELQQCLLSSFKFLVPYESWDQLEEIIITTFIMGCHAGEPGPSKLLSKGKQRNEKVKQKRQRGKKKESESEVEQTISVLKQLGTMIEIQWKKMKAFDSKTPKNDAEFEDFYEMAVAFATGKMKWNPRTNSSEQPIDSEKPGTSSPAPVEQDAKDEMKNEPDALLKELDDIQGTWDFYKLTVSKDQNMQEAEDQFIYMKRHIDYEMKKAAIAQEQAYLFKKLAEFGKELGASQLEEVAKLYERMKTLKKEYEDLTKEQEALQKNQASSKKELGALLKEEVAPEKVQGALQENQVTPGKEQDALLKEEVAPGKDQEALLKEEVASEKEKDALLKEEVAPEKEKDALLKEEVASENVQDALLKEEVVPEKEQGALVTEEVAPETEKDALLKEEVSPKKKKWVIPKRKRPDPPYKHNRNRRAHKKRSPGAETDILIEEPQNAPEASGQLPESPMMVPKEPNKCDSCVNSKNICKKVQIELESAKSTIVELRDKVNTTDNLERTVERMEKEMRELKEAHEAEKRKMEKEHSELVKYQNQKYEELKQSASEQTTSMTEKICVLEARLMEKDTKKPMEVKPKRRELQEMTRRLNQQSAEVTNLKTLLIQKEATQTRLTKDNALLTQETSLLRNEVKSLGLQLNSARTAEVEYAAVEAYVKKQQLKIAELQEENSKLKQTLGPEIPDSAEFLELRRNYEIVKFQNEYNAKEVERLVIELAKMKMEREYGTN